MADRRRTRRHRLGFSLTEVVVAIGILLALTASMFAFLSDLLESRDRVRALTARQRAVATLVDRLERDLASCLVGDDVNGAGVSGENNRIRVMSRGVPVARAQDGGGFGDLQLTEYRFDEARGLLVAWARAGADDRGVGSRLGEDIFRVRFRFHDGRRWADSFDSLASNRLPVAVEVAVWFEPWPGEEPADEPEDAEGDLFDDTEEEGSSRRTFDEFDTFDEDAEAAAAAFEFADEPDPDRLRIIVIPDAAGDEEDASSDADDGDEDVVDDEDPREEESR